MGKLLLSAHVLAAIILIGPVTVAVSLFPRYARQALTEATRGGRVGAPAPGASGGEAPAVDGRSASEPVVRLLHRISRVYSVLGLAVPVLGLALAVQLGVLGDVWLLASIVLTVAAAILLAAVVLPAQHQAMALLDSPSGGAEPASAVDRWVAGAKRLSMSSGIFALLWAVVVVLMVVRPGSTTGV